MRDLSGLPSSTTAGDDGFSINDKRENRDSHADEYYKATGVDFKDNEEILMINNCERDNRKKGCIEVEDIFLKRGVSLLMLV